MKLRPLQCIRVWKRDGSVNRMSITKAVLNLAEARKQQVNTETTMAQRLTAYRAILLQGHVAETPHAWFRLAPYTTTATATIN